MPDIKRRKRQALPSTHMPSCAKSECFPKAICGLNAVAQGTFVVQDQHR